VSEGAPASRVLILDADTLVTALVAFGRAAVVIFKKLAYGDPVPGYPSLIVVILFLGGIRLVSLGIIGEYLGRMFDETKRRPLYLVKDYQPANLRVQDLHHVV